MESAASCSLLRNFINFHPQLGWGWNWLWDGQPPPLIALLSDQTNRKRVLQYLDNDTHYYQFTKKSSKRMESSFNCNIIGKVCVLGFWVFIIPTSARASFIEFQRPTWLHLYFFMKSSKNTYNPSCNNLFTEDNTLQFHVIGRRNLCKMSLRDTNRRKEQLFDLIVYLFYPFNNSLLQRISYV